MALQNLTVRICIYCQNCFPNLLKWILYGKDCHDKTDDLRLNQYPYISDNIARLPVLTWEQAGYWDMSCPVTKIPGINNWVDVMTKTAENSFLLHVEEMR
ncbi:Putative SOS-response transcriptional repressor [Escherichia coli]|uniref:SOS-response transcriptional repressor n=1 Tax=Escherichia coli TaxID=562 RepID=A0A376ZWR6_ECOLX|nr:Putative SOS-response transcriptional repressor [Escherichia coli]